MEGWGEGEGGVESQPAFAYERIRYRDGATVCVAHNQIAGLQGFERSLHLASSHFIQPEHPGVLIERITSVEPGYSFLGTSADPSKYGLGEISQHTQLCQLHFALLVV